MIKTGNRNFWIAQFFGWGLFMLSNFSVQISAGFPVDMLMYNSITPLFIGFLITAGYRHFIKKSNWKIWSFRKIVGMIFISTFFLSLVFMLILFAIFFYVYKVEGMTFPSFLGNMVIFSLVILVWNVIYFFVHFFNNWNQAEIEKWKMAAEMKDAQLGSLKSQINPHFLFNTLNSLYALALTKSSKTPEAILKLSGLMRYVVTESSQKYIQIEKEVDYIRNFIELQRLRLAENVELICHLDGDYRNLEITPLILISIIENAFKYGLDLDAHSKISISVCIEKGKLILNVENSIAKRIADKTVSSTELGLANTRKQLRIFYPEKHVLTIEHIGGQYKVNLEIQLT
jgi:sensor histidine kinase YesM